MNRKPLVFSTRPKQTIPKTKLSLRFSYEEDEEISEIKHEKIIDYENFKNNNGQFIDGDFLFGFGEQF